MKKCIRITSNCSLPTSISLETKTAALTSHHRLDKLEFFPSITLAQTKFKHLHLPLHRLRLLRRCRRRHCRSSKPTLQPVQRPPRNPLHRQRRLAHLIQRETPPHPRKRLDHRRQRRTHFRRRLHCRRGRCRRLGASFHVLAKRAQRPQTQQRLRCFLEGARVLERPAVVEVPLAEGLADAGRGAEDAVQGLEACGLGFVREASDGGALAGDGLDQRGGDVAVA